ncbi:MAG: translation initiation factor IF-3, partial [Actinobacteria bacterium ATB1]|nr:translation initiation factor IF-3 [Actinobacteria bacterium ATB1]
ADLVEVAAQANPPVCKVMDWGKHLYEESQRQKESRKKQAQVIVKEMKFRPKIDVHDYETKKKHVVRFLEDGAKVKITIMFRGREMTHTELGKKILDQLADDLEEIATVEAQPKLDGRNMIMVLNPLVKKEKDVKAEAEPEERRKKTKGKGRRRREQGDVAGDETETLGEGDEDVKDVKDVAGVEDAEETSSADPVHAEATDAEG